MAIVCTNITSGKDEDGGSESTTVSVTLTANKLYLLTISQRRGDTTDPVEPTASSTGATWGSVNSVVFDSTSSSRRRVTVLRTMVTTDQTGAITITHGSNVSDATWILDEIAGVDTSGTNGSSAIVQSVVNKDEGGAATSLSVTLAAFNSTRNGTYGAFGWDGSPTMTAGTGFTEMDEQHDSVSDVACGTEFRIDNDTGVDATFSSASLIGGVAIELRAEATVVYLKGRRRSRIDLTGISAG